MSIDASPSRKSLTASLSRRTVLAAAGAATAAIAGQPVSRGVLAQPAALPRELGPGWTHVVGGGGSLLFYNQDTGAGLCGTLDGDGWRPVETYDDFSTGWNLVVATQAGSVLFVNTSTGAGAGGTIADGRWSYLTDYSDFATIWTHAVATRDSVLFYEQGTGIGAGGVLINGQWTYLTDYDDFFAGYTHLTGSDDSILLYAADIGFGATGTLENGGWEWLGTYDDFATDWSLQAGTGNTLLLVEADTGLGAGGFLSNGTWEWISEYGDFSIGWTHVTSAGNGHVVFYDAETGLGAWGALDGGEWFYLGTVPGAEASGSGLDALDELGRAYLAETAVPGISVAIARNGNLVYTGAFGRADSDGEDVTTESRFRIASVSKPFTSVAIMTLVESGQLNLDDRVFGDGALLGTEYGTNPYTPDVEAITVEHLLTHTAGGWSNDLNDPMYVQTNLDADELITWVLDNRPLDNAPGTAWAYSNFGYCVLGRVIEHVSGQDYDDYVRDAVLDPCGITSLQIAGNTLAERADGEVTYDPGNTPPNLGLPYEIPVSRMDAHGGWIGTATDLLRFAVRVDNFGSVPDILAGDTISTITTPSAANPVDADPGYAMGWWVNDIDNWWHDGILAGTSAFLVRSSDGICWAALANGNGIDLERLVWGMIDQVDAWPPGDPL